MKINKLLNSKNKLINLVLFNVMFKTFQDKKLSDIITRVKKILHVVYKYHMLNKKILFIGTPMKNHFYIEKIIKKTKHIAVPESVWVNGLITNRKYCFRHLAKKQAYLKKSINKLLLKLNKSIDLIVILDNIENNSLIQEIHHAQIPIIYLNNSKNKNYRNLNFNYTLELDLNKKKVVSNFFFAMLKTIIKKIPPIQKIRPNFFYKKKIKKT